MKIEKKHLIVAGIGVVSLAAAGIYWQYTKLMNYCIGFKKIKVNSITADNANFDLYINFKNNSKLSLNVLSQEYNVYVNDKFITKAINNNPQVLAPESMSVISVNVKFNPTQAGQNILSAILKLGNTSIKIDTKLKVKLWFFTVNIPYIYNTTIKELMSPTTKGESSLICKK